MNREEYFEEFRPFFNATCVELERHDKEKGSSWKGDTFTRVKTSGHWAGPNTYVEPVMEEVSQDQFITEILHEHYEKYAIYNFFSEKAAAQEVDLAALLGMLWLRRPREQQVPYEGFER